jgi:ubiquinone/menaquinone biosynthesis C-methylase UbiE
LTELNTPAGLKPAVAAVWQKLYPHYDERGFEAFVKTLVRPDMEVLEIGAGSGAGTQAVCSLRGQCRHHVGIDLDPRVLGNPQLDEAHVADAAQLPFPDERFDLVFHRFVAEHLDDPVRAFTEAMRVLRPGGAVVFATPNQYYYPMIVARMTPTWLHAFLVRRLGSGRVSDDVFPTFYRINSARRIRRCAAHIGAQVEILRIGTPPGYLRRSLPLFLIGVLYERTLERLIPALRAGLWVRMTKPARPANAPVAGDRRPPSSKAGRRT